MTMGFDEFAEQLLYDVALAAHEGIPVEEVEIAVGAFYGSEEPNEQHDVDNKNGSIHPVLPNEKQSDSNTNHSRLIWEWLEKHPEVEIKHALSDNAAASATDLNEAVQTQDAESTEKSFSKFSGKRIYASNNRIWRAITGHDVDQERLPPMQFRLLAIIAGHGPEGMVQPDLTEVSQQDKRSVPKRTDDLATKGYISKSRVIILNKQTAILKLKKFTTHGAAAAPKYLRAYPRRRKVDELRTVYYDEWYHEFLRMTKENGGIIATEDLRIGLKIHKSPWGRRAMKRCLERLVETGLVRKLRASVQDQDGDTFEDLHIRCVQLLREPTESDRIAFTGSCDPDRTRKAKRKNRGPNGTRIEAPKEQTVSDEEEEGSSEAPEEDDVSDGQYEDEELDFLDSQDVLAASQSRQRAPPEGERASRPIRNRRNPSHTLVDLSDSDEEQSFQLDPKMLARKEGRASLAVSGTPHSDHRHRVEQSASSSLPGILKETPTDWALSFDLDEWWLINPTQRSSIDKQNSGGPSGGKVNPRNPFQCMQEDADLVQVEGDTTFTNPTRRKRRKLRATERLLATTNMAIPPSTQLNGIQTKAERVVGLAKMDASKKMKADETDTDAQSPVRKIQRVDNGAMCPSSQTPQLLPIKHITPGVEINPHSSIEARFATRKRPGKRPKSIIAAFRSSRLTNLSCFRSEHIEAPSAHTAKPQTTSSTVYHIMEEAINNENDSIERDQAPSLGERQPTPRMAKEMGRPTKVKAAEVEQRGPASLDKQHTPGKLGCLATRAPDATFVDGNRTFSSPGENAASSSLPSSTPLARKERSTTSTPSKITSLPQMAAPNSSTVKATLPPRKRGRPSNAELAQRKKQKLGGSLIVRLPLPKARLLELSGDLASNSIRDSSMISETPATMNTSANQATGIRQSRMLSEPLSPDPPFPPRELTHSAGVEDQLALADALSTSDTQKRPEMQREICWSDNVTPDSPSTDAERAKPALTDSDDMVRSHASLSKVVKFAIPKPAQRYPAQHNSSNGPENINRAEPQSANEIALAAISCMASVHSNDQITAPSPPLIAPSAPSTSNDDSPFAMNTSTSPHLTFTRKSTFPVVEGITVRRTAEAIAVLEAESQDGVDSGEESPSRSRSRRARKRAKVAKGKRRRSSSAVVKSASGDETAHSRLLMFPGQVFCSTAGTIGTVSVVGSHSPQFDLLETEWIIYHSRPSGLQHVLNQGEQLGYVACRAYESADDRFKHEIDRVERWEVNLVEHNVFADLGGRKVFINHGLDCPFPPALKYLKFTEDDFFRQSPPFEVTVKRRTPASSKPRTKAAVDVAESDSPLMPQSHGRRTTSSLTHPSPPLDHPKSALAETVRQEQHVPYNRLIMDSPSHPCSTFGSNFAPRLYPGSDLPTVPLLSQTTYQALSYPVPGFTAFTPNSRYNWYENYTTGPRTSDTSMGGLTNRSQTPATAEGLNVEAIHAGTVLPAKRGRKPNPQRVSEYPEARNKTGGTCTNCAQNNCGCYGGSGTERCAFCKLGNSRCSLVAEDREIVAQKAENSGANVDKAREKADRARFQVEKKAGLAANTQYGPPMSQVETITGLYPGHPTPNPSTNTPSNKCGRCKGLNKPCIAGSTTERCGFCKATRSLCSKVDVDRAKLVRWDRHQETVPRQSDQSRQTVGPQSADGLDSETVDSPLPDCASDDGIQGGESENTLSYNFTDAHPRTAGNKKRHYTYKEGERPAARTTSSSSINGTNSKATNKTPVRTSTFAEPRRLAIAVALADTLCTDTDHNYSTNWNIVAHALAFKYNKATLKNAWNMHKGFSGEDAQRLQRLLHESILAGYESGSIPHLDFENPDTIDWPGLVRWVETQAILLDHAQELPISRRFFEQDFDVIVPSVAATEGRSAISDNGLTIQTHGTTELRSTPHRPCDLTGRSTSMTLAKSWIRAITMTKEDVYDQDRATQKLLKLDRDLLKQASTQLEQSHTLVRKHAGRHLPGRNYTIAKEALLPFKRWSGNSDDVNFLTNVTRARTTLLEYFNLNNELVINNEMTDEETLVLINMVAQGHLNIALVLPTLDADLPWKTTEGDGSFHFPIVYTRTAKFTQDHQLKCGIPIPSEPLDRFGDAIPFWVDIHGNLLDEVWDMVLRSVLHMLVFNAGVTSKGIERAHGGHLGIWEIEMVLRWMEQVGLAEKDKSNGRDGWRVTEWWHCVSAPGVSNWKASTSSGAEAA